MKIGNVSMISFLVSILSSDNTVEAHGAMSFPPARNYIFPKTCPHCANGVGVCGDGKNSQWVSNVEPSVTHGSYFRLERPVLYAGGLVEVSVYFTVGHLGIFVVELCHNPGEVISEDCFKRLDRDPTDETYSPYLPEAPHIFFLPENACITKATKSAPLTARFILPDDTVTSHAVLRYLWWTGNSCSPSDFSNRPTLDKRISDWRLTVNGVTDCKLAVTNFTPCGTDCPHAGCNGEKFANCADVAIHSDINAANNVVSNKDHTTTKEDVTAKPATIAPGVSTPARTTFPTTTTTTTHGSAANVSSTSHTVAPCTPGGPVVGDIAECRSKLISFGGFDDFCRGNCDIMAADEADDQRWCRARSICDLTTCVATFWSDVCRIQ